MKIYTNDLVKGHSDFKVKCLTFGLYTQVSDSGPLGPLVPSCFQKGDNFHHFLFTYLEDKVFKKWGLLLKERICSLGSKFFSLRVDP